MTMHKIHIMHWPDWHHIKVRLGQLAHDPRFWAVLIIGGLVAAMIVVSILFGSGQTAGSHPYVYPFYPYMP